MGLGNLDGKNKISYSNAFTNGNWKFRGFRGFRGIWCMSGAAARTGNLKEKREYKLYKKGKQYFNRNNIKQ